MEGLKLEKLNYSYGKYQVLKEINLSVKAGRFCVLLGANGAGKSTLVKCINGLLHPQNGSIFWKDRDTSTLSLREKARIFGYVPQNTQTGQGLTVMETVLSGRLPHAEKTARLTGKVHTSDLELAASLLQEFGLEKFAFCPAGTLSGGENQRVLIARAVAQNPQVLLLDEPISNLDLRYQIEVMELLKQLSHEKGLTVIAVIHDLNLALEYADQVTVMKQGAIAASGPPKEAANAQILGDAYGIPVEVLEVKGRTIVLPVQFIKAEGDK